MQYHNGVVQDLISETLKCIHVNSVRASTPTLKYQTKSNRMHFARICQKFMVALSRVGSDSTALLDAAERCKETDEYRYTGDHSTEDEADL